MKLTPHNSLAGSRFQPLSHLSKVTIYYHSRLILFVNMNSEQVGEFFASIASNPIYLINFACSSDLMRFKIDRSSKELRIS